MQAWQKHLQTKKITALQEKGLKAEKDALVNEINAASLVTKNRVLTELLLVPEFWTFSGRYSPYFIILATFQDFYGDFFKLFAVQGCESLSKLFSFQRVRN